MVNDTADSQLFDVHCVPRQGLDTLTQKILNAKRSLKSITKPPKAGSTSDRTAAQAFEAIGQNLNWHYCHTDITRMPAKLSVSELTHRDDEFAAAGIERGFSQRPAAVIDTEKKAARPDALSLGSAYHLIMEHLDLSEPVDKETVGTTLKELTTSGALSKTLAAGINTASIVAFFDSPPGQLAQRAGTRVLREWPFTYGLDAAAVGATSGDETIVLQGIVDMIIPTGDGLVVVDFKTDRIEGDEIAERAKRYTEQLTHYTRAAAAILNQPVTAAWLYFLTPRKAIPCDS
jgi:ATP-dependent helicase/nuclease subunit A